MCAIGMAEEDAAMTCAGGDWGLRKKEKGR